jgi:hypothetical protein
MGAYSKLIGSLVGSIVAVILAYLAVKGLATCTPGPDGTQACAIWGFSDSQITGAIVSVISAVFVYAFPRNVPPS